MSLLSTCNLFPSSESGSNSKGLRHSSIAVPPLPNWKVFLSFFIYFGLPVQTVPDLSVRQPQGIYSQAAE